MTAPTSTPRAGDGDLTNLALIGIGILVVLAAVLWVAGVITTLITRRHLPRGGGGLASGIMVIVHPGDPQSAWPPGSGVPCPVVYWSVFGALVAMLGVVAVVIFRVRSRLSVTPNARRRTLHGTQGVATRAAIIRDVGPKALSRRAATLRPVLAATGTKVLLQDIGYRLGQAHGVDVWASVEDSILIVGPPRSGKGLHLVINTILDAPGAVVTTSTRPDSLTVTHRARARVGDVSVFDPQNLAGLPTGLRWSPIRGCETPRTAMVRAGALAAATGMSNGGVNDGGFCQDQTRTTLQALLHAAALDHARIDRLYRWTIDPTAAQQAVTILAHHPDAATGWEDNLDAAIHADARTRDSIWLGVRQTLTALADPGVRAALDPDDDATFDPEAFLSGRNTLYLLGTGIGIGATAGLLAALIEDITETARRLATRSPGSRLDPPVAFILDEIANLTPLPSLPTLMADGGGTGITPIVVLQSLAQARTKWGIDAAGAIWDAAITKIILGGGSNTRDLKELSELIGQRDDRTISHSHGPDGRRSTTAGQRRIEILGPDLIRSLPFGTALTLLRTTAPIVTDLTPWTNRPDAKQLQVDQQAIEARASATAS